MMISEAQLSQVQVIYPGRIKLQLIYAYVSISCCCTPVTTAELKMYLKTCEKHIPVVTKTFNNSVAFADGLWENLSKGMKYRNL